MSAEHGSAFVKLLDDQGNTIYLNLGGIIQALFATEGEQLVAHVTTATPSAAAPAVLRLSGNNARALQDVLERRQVPPMAHRGRPQRTRERALGLHSGPH